MSSLIFYWLTLGSIGMEFREQVRSTWDGGHRVWTHTAWDRILAQPVLPVSFCASIFFSSARKIKIVSMLIQLCDSLTWVHVWNLLRAMPGAHRWKERARQPSRWHYLLRTSLFFNTREKGKHHGKYSWSRKLVLNSSSCSVYRNNLCCPWEGACV